MKTSASGTENRQMRNGSRQTKELKKEKIDDGSREAEGVQSHVDSGTESRRESQI